MQDSSLINKYGAIVSGSALATVERALVTALSPFFQELVADPDVSPLEIRAVSQLLSGTVSCIAADAILNKSMGIRQAEREEDKCRVLQ